MLRSSSSSNDRHAVCGPEVYYRTRAILKPDEAGPSPLLTTRASSSLATAFSAGAMPTSSLR